MSYCTVRTGRGIIMIFAGFAPWKCFLFRTLLYDTHNTKQHDTNIVPLVVSSKLDEPVAAAVAPSPAAVAPHPPAGPGFEAQNQQPTPTGKNVCNNATIHGYD